MNISQIIVKVTDSSSAGTIYLDNFDYTPAGTTDYTTEGWLTPRFRLHVSDNVYAEGTITEIGPVSRNLQTWEGRFSVSDLTGRIVDVDEHGTPYSHFWATFNPDSGTRVLNLPMFLETSANSGTTWATLWRGNVRSYEWQDGEVSITGRDLMRRVQDMRFIWDYESLSGTVTSLSGSNAYFAAASISGSLFSGGTSGTGGNKLKFWASNMTHTDGSNGYELREESYYTLSSGSLIGAAGTLELRPTPPNTIVGRYIYERKDLTFSGIPSDIVSDMLTGSFYNYDPVPSGSLVTSGTTSVLTMEFSGTVETEGTGGVLEEIGAICQSCLADFYADEENILKFDVFAPLRLCDKSPLHLNELSGTKQILPGFVYTESAEDVYDRVVLEYDHDPEIGSYLGHAEGTNSDLYNDISQTKLVQSKWIRDRSEANVVVDRMLARQRSGVGRISLPTTYYAIFGSLNMPIEVTHRAGSLGTALFIVDGYDKDLEEFTVTLRAYSGEVLHSRRGYAYWGKPSDGGDGSLGETVTATSVSAWCQQAFTDDALIDGDLDGWGGGTLVNWGSRIGTGTAYIQAETGTVQDAGGTSAFIKAQLDLESVIGGGIYQEVTGTGSLAGSWTATAYFLITSGTVVMAARENGGDDTVYQSRYLTTGFATWHAATLAFNKDDDSNPIVLYLCTGSTWAGTFFVDSVGLYGPDDDANPCPTFGTGTAFGYDTTWIGSLGFSWW